MKGRIVECGLLNCEWSVRPDNYRDVENVGSFLPQSAKSITQRNANFFYYFLLSWNKRNKSSRKH